MITRKIITNIISIIIIAVLFYFLWDIYEPLVKLFNRLELSARHYMLAIVMNLMIALICFLSMRNWFEYFLDGGIKIKIIPLIVGIVVLILGAIPAAVWIVSFGFGGNGNIGMLLNTSAIHFIVSAVGGILIGRSFGHKSEALSDK